MIRPNRKSADNAQKGSRSTQEMFHLLVSDVHQLLVRKSEAAERENEGRTSVMRTLRQLRDWITDRSTILNTLHSSLSPTGNPRFVLTHQSLTTPKAGQFVKSYKSPFGPGHTSRDQSNLSTVLNPPPAVTDSAAAPAFAAVVVSASRDSDPLTGAAAASPDGDFTSGSFGHDDRLHRPFATSTPHPPADRPHHAALPSVDPSEEIHVQAISSVLDGVQLLERQLREYVHLEILLTDKFRYEMRMKQLHRKSLGFTSKGINEAQNTMKKLSSGSCGSVSGAENLGQLQTQLDRICQEYDECSKYMDKVATSMTQIDDVEAFLKSLHEREKAYHKYSEKEKRSDKDNRKDNKSKSQAIMKFNKESRKKDPYEALVELLKRSNHHTNDKQIRKSHSFGKSSTFSKTVRLPLISSPGGEMLPVTDQPSEDLMTKMKLLVANYEVVRLRTVTLEDRLRRELSRTERKAESLIKARDDEIFRLQTLLRETEAEKEKYRKLYENTKIGATRKY